MAKDPAFLFYTSDFLSGVSDLTMEERGQYITLLCLQHQKGHLSDKVINLCVGNATADVLHKFSIDNDGLYFSPRLDIEIAKRVEHSQKQRKRALDGWEKRKATADATALPLENRNENENIYISFNHLSITYNEFEKLKIEFPTFNEKQINNCFDRIKNFKNNTKYNSLYLTAQSWLKRDLEQIEIKSPTSKKRVIS
jgi:uncharacterized protein YdaU (DUF1376 family)